MPEIPPTDIIQTGEKQKGIYDFTHVTPLSAQDMEKVPVLEKKLDEAYQAITSRIQTSGIDFIIPIRPAIYLCDEADMIRFHVYRTDREGIPDAYYDEPIHAIYFQDSILAKLAIDDIEATAIVYEELIHALTNTYDQEKGILRTGFNTRSIQNESSKLLVAQSRQQKPGEKDRFLLYKWTLDSGLPKRDSQEQPRTAEPQPITLNTVITERATHFLAAMLTDCDTIAAADTEAVAIRAFASKNEINDTYRNITNGRDITTDILGTLASGDIDQMHTIATSCTPQQTSRWKFIGREKQATQRVAQILTTITDPNRSYDIIGRV